jgi:DNA-directed RNA polymerase subunit omega
MARRAPRPYKRGMARVSAEDCLKRLPNHFALCILAARRARELAAGHPPSVVCDNKAAVTALREIAAGKVSFTESLDEAILMHISDSKALDGQRRKGGPRRGSRAQQP